MIDELVLLRCGEVEPSSSRAGELSSSADLKAAFDQTVSRLCSGTLYMGKWTQFDAKYGAYPCTITAKDCVILVTIKHTTLRRYAPLEETDAFALFFPLMTHLDPFAHLSVCLSRLLASFTHIHVVHKITNHQSLHT